MWQLLDETKRLLPQLRVGSSELRVKPQLATRNSQLSTGLPKQIAFNVIPQVDIFLDNRSTKEEMKMVHETRKILGEPRLAVSATCARVPVFVAHSEAVWIETEHPLSVERARALLRRAPGVRLVDEPRAGAYPLPIDAAGQDDVLVGRLRKDDTVAHGLALWVCGDNLRKGAATNAVQIAELLIRKSL